MKIEGLDNKTFARAIDGLDERNFDGHTDFDELSLEKRLQRLSVGAQFCLLAKSIPDRRAVRNVGRKYTKENRARRRSAKRQKG